MGGLLTRRDSRGGEGHGHDVTSEGAADVLKHKVNCVLRLLRQARHRDARHRVRSTHGQRRLGHDAFPHTVHDPCRRRRIGAGERHHEVRPAWGRGHQIEARAGARDVTGAGVPGPHGQGCIQPGGWHGQGRFARRGCQAGARAHVPWPSRGGHVRPPSLGGGVSEQNCEPGGRARRQGGGGAQRHRLGSGRQQYAPLPRCPQAPSYTRRGTPHHPTPPPCQANKQQAASGKRTW